ncbi:MAG: DUF4215 domain-containing protein, partial [Candidatus Dojkabacteria bacterium]
PVCGNGIVEGSELCDDGNTDNLDGCSVTCSTPVCGNGILELGEECEGGNSCDSNCRIDYRSLPICNTAIQGGVGNSRGKIPLPNIDRTIKLYLELWTYDVPDRISMKGSNTGRLYFNRCFQYYNAVSLGGCPSGTRYNYTLDVISINPSREGSIEYEVLTNCAGNDPTSNWLIRIYCEPSVRCIGSSPVRRR